MSEPDRFRRAEELFRAARDLPPERREAFLDERCADDAALRAEVAALLRADDATHGALDQPAVGVGVVIEALGRRQRPQAVPESIGRYQVIARIGTGGMGAVYEARQERPRRAVALKVINAGVASADLLRRLEHEAQVLGRLQHPGIAQVFEAGTFDAGDGPQPFFAMELIRGAPLTSYAAARGLGTRERLDLIRLVCDAVQHAHQRGVIHRDLKPANILVNEDGQPKILDFGVARATDADIQTATLRTDIGQLVGTIPYMSPEQASGDPGEIDTRSDVYALGVIAYELLAGRLPHDVQERMVHEAVRMIREDEPTPLSSIDRALRGDVETIVGKALERDKTRRYASAAALGEDIARYLADEPIAGRPPSRLYQVRKFAKRNKAIVVGAAAVVVALAAGAVVSTVYAVREARALAAERNQWMLAQRQSAIAAAVNEFLNQDLLGSVAPSAEQGRGRDVLMREVLDEAARRIGEGRFEGQPEVEAAVRATLGATYHALGEYAPAEPHLRRSLELLRGELGGEHPDTLTVLNRLALLETGKGGFTEAEAMFEEVLAARRRVLGEEHADTLRTMNDMALLRREQSRYDEAELLYTQVLEARRRLYGDDHADTLATMTNLALLYRDLARYEEAVELYLRSLEARRRTLGEEHPDTLTTLNNLAGVYTDMGRYTEAEPLIVKTLEARRRILGREHPHTLLTANNLAHLYGVLRRHEDAEKLHAETLGIQQRVLGNEHPDTLMSMNNLALAISAQGRSDGAIAIWGKVIEARRRILGEDHPATLNVMNNLAVEYYYLGRYEETARLFDKTLELRRRSLGEQHPATLQSMNNLAGLYRRTGRLEEAQSLYEETISVKRRVLGDTHPDTLVSLYGLASTLIAAGDFDDAEPVAVECYEGNVKQFGAEHGETTDAIDLLIRLYEAWEKPVEAARWREELPDTGDTGQ